LLLRVWLAPTSQGIELLLFSRSFPLLVMTMSSTAQYIPAT
jgi:hypothetical protein